jgi:hypothetical protein
MAQYTHHLTYDGEGEAHHVESQDVEHQLYGDRRALVHGDNFVRHNAAHGDKERRRAY